MTTDTHDHADAARVALVAFVGPDHPDELQSEDAIDLIADLLHYLTREGWNAREALEDAEKTYTSDLEEEGHDDECATLCPEAGAESCKIGHHCTLCAWLA